MTNIANHQETARKNAEKITRNQTIRAMENLIVGMGGKNAYIAWLEAMPEDATLGLSGGISTATIAKISEDDVLFNRIVKVFAANMGPILTELASEE